MKLALDGFCLLKVSTALHHLLYGPSLGSSARPSAAKQRRNARVTPGPTTRVRLKTAVAEQQWDVGVVDENL